MTTSKKEFSTSGLATELWGNPLHTSLSFLILCFQLRVGFISRSPTVGLFVRGQGLHDTSSIVVIKMSPDVAKCPWGVIIAPS